MSSEKSSSSSHSHFNELGLPQPLLRALETIGYESPSPVQAACIPAMLTGKDIIGQAQTGTGKTAAFALPSLAQIDLDVKKPQVCVVCPTRELALQVAESFSEYAKFMTGFRILPIYGGQPYPAQIKALKRGVHVVVGTPGRVMDHMRKGTLNFDALKTVVLDEADEMLRMGFIDDVETILSAMPDERQTALFSATMPKAIKQVGERFLTDPEHIKIASEARTASTVEQCVLTVGHAHKFDALQRVLESETFDAAIIFMRTKTACDELAVKLSAHGFAAEAVHGDMAQNQREKTVQRLKDGASDIVIATDVAARGLDVERITHVINYDIPHDAESYVHRIGRTGRAGREGKAILFVTPREKRMLNMLERHNSTKIKPLKLPSIQAVNDARTQRFIDDVQASLLSDKFREYLPLMTQIQDEHDQSGIEIAAAIAGLLFKDKPLILEDLRDIPESQQGERNNRHAGETRKITLDTRAEQLSDDPDVSMQRFVVHAGRSHGVMPKNILGAIANEADLDRQYIGAIKLYHDISTVDLPEEMPPEIMQILKKTRICGRKAELETVENYIKKHGKDVMQSSGTGGGGSRGKGKFSGKSSRDFSGNGGDRKRRGNDKHDTRKKRLKGSIKKKRRD